MSDAALTVATGALVYVDTSAALKLLIEERESHQLAAWLQDATGRSCILCASLLLHTELHCACARRALIKTSAVDQLLAGIELIDLERKHLLQASEALSGLRAADAIHLAVARAVGAQAVVTYDHELAHAAALAGIQPCAPGQQA